MSLTLDKPFRKVAQAIELSKRTTPRGMRRTFQDLFRAAAVGDLVTRSISGHGTEAMQRHYCTVALAEQRRGLSNVIQLIDPDPDQPRCRVGRVAARVGRAGLTRTQQED